MQQPEISIHPLIGRLLKNGWVVSLLPINMWHKNDKRGNRYPTGKSTCKDVDSLFFSLAIKTYN